MEWNQLKCIYVLMCIPLILLLILTSSSTSVCSQVFRAALSVHVGGTTSRARSVHSGSVPAFPPSGSVTETTTAGTTATRTDAVSFCLSSSGSPIYDQVLVSVHIWLSFRTSLVFHSWTTSLPRLKSNFQKYSLNVQLSVEDHSAERGMLQTNVLIPTLL